MDHGAPPTATDLHAAWLACMGHGDFEGAWAVSDRVLGSQHPATRDDPRVPYHQRWVWDGRPFDGRHVLVRCYHGLGDTLQFARFLPLLGQRAASVTLECQPGLVPLLRPMPGVDRIVPFDLAAPAAPAECDVEIMELGFALRARPEAAPAPYLAAHPAAVPDGSIGLCWQVGDWERDRVIPPELLRPLTAWPCYSLVPGPTTLPVLNLGGGPGIAETAGLIAGLALVVTVDTMVAHLAGALGRPTWLLLKHDADWRWMQERTDTPWYPTMRLYRQSAPGDWAGVMRRLESDLQRFVPRQREERSDAAIHTAPGAGAAPYGSPRFAREDGGE